MTDVPYDFVRRHVEHIMQRHGEFHYAEIGGKMPAVALGDLYDALAQKSAVVFKLGYAHVLYIGTSYRRVIHFYPYFNPFCPPL